MHFKTLSAKLASTVSRSKWVKKGNACYYLSYFTDLVANRLAWAMLSTIDITNATISQYKLPCSGITYIDESLVRRIHGWPVNIPHKGPATRKMFPFHDVILFQQFDVQRWVKYMRHHTKPKKSGNLVQHCKKYYLMPQIGCHGIRKPSEENMWTWICSKLAWHF